MLLVVKLQRSAHKDVAVFSIHLHLGKEMPEFLIQWTIYTRSSNTVVRTLSTCTPLQHEKAGSQNSTVETRPPQHAATGTSDNDGIAEESASFMWG